MTAGVTKISLSAARVTGIFVMLVGCDWAAADGPWNEPPDDLTPPELVELVGSVWTADASRTVAGADVELRDGDGVVVASTRTDPFGAFAIADVASSTWTLAAESGHFSVAVALDLEGAEGIVELDAVRLSATLPVVLDVRDEAGTSFDPVGARLGALGVASVRAGPETAAVAAELFGQPQGLFEYGLVLVGGDLDYGVLLADPQAMDGLREYVEAGGGLYLGGEAGVLLEPLAPGAVSPSGALAAYGYTEAFVPDAELREHLQWDDVGVPTVEGMAIPGAAAPDARVWLAGDVETTEGATVTAPLAVEVALGEGSILLVAFRAPEPRVDEWWQGDPDPWMFPDGSWDGRGAVIDRLLLGL